ncbi:MAG: hypothetical protein A2W91_05715 [Bacteroidetes bacterium GWF2_38_335]|nr:MAG: hypothetical protein A2W91_05715 [Bacteroidetes bacterium GWF2_38_335]HBS88922.1 hypothetical protein [Bacteroidales bacterium]
MGALNKLASIKIRPESIFAFFALIFGLLFVFLTPPFQSPDENNHFYRAYQISEGHLISEKIDNRLVAFVPQSLVKTTGPFTSLYWNNLTKTSFRVIRETLEIPLNPEKKQFVDIPNTAMYSPISYLPQAFILFLLKPVNLPPLYLFYCTRIFTLFFWVFCIFLAIRIIPFYKWLFILVALLPMSLFINASISADVMTNIISFFLIAFILNAAYSQPEIKTRHLVFIIGLSIFLALSKVVYTPLILLYFIIPRKKFGSKKKYIIQTCLLFAVSFISVFVWSSTMNSLYIQYNEYNEHFRDGITLVKCADMHKQLAYILDNGTYILDVFFSSTQKSFDMYAEGYIGTFGWLDTPLPHWLIYLSYFVIIFVGLADKDHKIKVKPKHKIIMFLGLFLIFFLIFITQHLTWDCVGSDYIISIQGRYFIPAFPLLFMLFYNSWEKIEKFKKPIIIAFILICSIISANTLYQRYFYFPDNQTNSFTCNAEKITREKLFITSNPEIFLENVSALSKEQSRSGNISVKLNNKNQSAFLYRNYKYSKGDSLIVEIWRYGKTGGIVIFGEKNIFFVSDTTPIMKDSKGWELLRLEYEIPTDMIYRETDIYITNPETDPVYFDDLKISFIKNNQ